MSLTHLRRRVRSIPSALAAFVLVGTSAVALATPSQANTEVVPQAGTTCEANASVYGVVPDTRLSYTAIDPHNGNRIATTLSTTKLGFTPKAMAALNFNTLLVTDSATGALWRIDISTNSSVVGYSKTKLAASGWTHDSLTFDGENHLYGTAKGLLLRYTVQASKPSITQIVSRSEIGTGFTLRSIASSGRDSFYGNTSTGGLVEYTVSGTSWSRVDRATSGWSDVTDVVSPWGGIVYGKTTAGAMKWGEQSYNRFGIHSSDPVDTSGWTQNVISAVPAACGTSRATIAVDFAMRQIGDGYLLGANGPDLWDCSGLTKGAWAKAGVTLPRWSGDQAKLATVAYSDRQPGDVLIYPGHVALYVGNGKMVEAPREGVNVRLTTTRTSGLGANVVRP